MSDCCLYPYPEVATEESCYPAVRETFGLVGPVVYTVRKFKSVWSCVGSIRVWGHAACFEVVVPIVLKTRMIPSLHCLPQRGRGVLPLR